MSDDLEKKNLRWFLLGPWEITLLKSIILCLKARVHGTIMEIGGWVMRMSQIHILESDNNIYVYLSSL